jgi:hypothetical protein
MFKAGRAVGKGVRYLTQLGSKIGKGLGSSVDKLGAGTRNTQASVIKGARGARDAANSAGAAARRGVKDAKAGYRTGRSGGLHLSDVQETSAQKYHHGKMAEAGRANFIQAKAPNRDKYIKANRPKGVTREAYNDFAKRNPDIVKKADKMRGGPIGGSGRGYMTNKGPKASDYKIGRRISDDEFVKSYQKPGMSKNRRAGIITGASIAAGYGVHKANDAMQNHYQRQKNSSR